MNRTTFIPMIIEDIDNGSKFGTKRDCIILKYPPSVLALRAESKKGILNGYIYIEFCLNLYYGLFEIMIILFKYIYEFLTLELITLFE